MSGFEVITLGLSVIQKLYPIAKEIYEAVSDPGKPEIQSGNAIEHIKERAKKEGLQIGHTEAEMVRSAIHFAKAKTKRHPYFTSKEE